MSLISAAVAGSPVSDFAKQSDDWFRTAAGRTVVDNVLSYQTPLGDWPKNIDDTSRPYEGDRAKLHGTFDNSATTEELRLLARAYRATKDERCSTALEKGIDHVLAAQYPSGGWPQTFPPGKGYDRYITFNDDTMVRIMQLLRDVAEDPLYTCLGEQRRAAAGMSFDRGIECILRCQVIAGGELTVWCAQHDERDFNPRPARTFELASLSGSESVRITRLLMSLENPSPQVIRAVDAAATWFEQAKLTGIRQDYEPDLKARDGKNKIVVPDPAAPPLWARFYSLETGRPIFVDRDGIPREKLSDIGYERRNGYGWLGTWPQDLLARDYPAWRKRLNR